MFKRPTYLWTLFFAFQGTVFILAYLAQLEGIPDDLWLLALAHIPVVMVIAFLEQIYGSKPVDAPSMYSCDEFAHLYTPTNQPR
jgi:bacteriorhodopsin